MSEVQPGLKELADQVERLRAAIALLTASLAAPLGIPRAKEILALLVKGSDE